MTEVVPTRYAGRQEIDDYTWDVFELARAARVTAVLAGNVDKSDPALVRIAVARNKPTAAAPDAMMVDGIDDRVFLRGPRVRAAEDWRTPILALTE